MGVFFRGYAAQSSAKKSCRPGKLHRSFRSSQGLPAPGHRDDAVGQLLLQTTYGYYWSWQAASTTNARRMRFNSAGYNTTTVYVWYGFSLRCIKI